MTDDLDLASLIASRLCHDVVGPVGAIQNGLELIAEDSAMADMAMELIKKSAHQASAKLQFARLAYGAAGGAETLDPGEAGKLTAAIFDGERAELVWDISGDAKPRNAVKIAMLLAAFALGAVPRGGTVTVREGAVVAEGQTVRTPPFSEILEGGDEVADPRAAQALVIARLVKAEGQTIEVTADEATVTFSLS
ncbi:MAG: histidine phosphotransferase family protein [Pseudomonadota bacterium]